MKKLIPFLLLTLLLVFAVPAAAESLPDGEPAPTASGTADTADAPAKEEETTAPDGTAQTNVFSGVYAYFCEHASEIFSTLAFAGSMILAFCYKKGLLPIMSGALGKLSGTVGELRELAEKTSLSTDSNVSFVLEETKKTETALASLAEHIALLQKKLDENAAVTDECEKLRTVMDTEIDMLYGIFMASALPQYQKDLIGERVAKMKTGLGGLTDEGVSS